MQAPQQKLQYPQAERQRPLQALTFAENQIISRDLPRDTVLKEIQLRLSGSVITTFASGTPVADAQAAFDNIIPRIDVIVGGSRTVKSVKPHLLRAQQLFSSTVLGERRSSAAAAAATDNFPTVDAGFTYGTTTQVTTCAESILLSFAMVYAEVGMGRESTWLNLKGVPSAELRLTCASFSSLLGFGNTAPVVFTGSTFIIDIICIEAQDVPAEIMFSDWKQTTKELTFSAQTSDYAIDINRGNKLSDAIPCLDSVLPSSPESSVADAGVPVQGLLQEIIRFSDSFVEYDPSQTSDSNKTLQSSMPRTCSTQT
jgi:hypothetical protein